MQESTSEGLKSQLGSLSDQLTEVSDQLEERERELSQLEEKYRTEVVEWGEDRGREREEREEEGRQAAEKLRSEVERLGRELEERLGAEKERYSGERVEEKRRLEEDRKRREEEGEREKVRLKEDHEIAVVRVREEGEEERRVVEEKCRGLECRLRAQEEGSGPSKDYRLATVQGKMFTLQQEVDSLKTVVDMRTTELHHLRAEKVRLEEKLELFDQTQVAMKKLSAQVEDLKSQLVARADSEVALQDENRRLHAMVMRENCEKKRLSMENEQLSYRMRGEDSPQAMSISYCEGTADSLPQLGSPRFSRGYRPLSAPPGKPGLETCPSPLPPHSPRYFTSPQHCSRS